MKKNQDVSKSGEQKPQPSFNPTLTNPEGKRAQQLIMTGEAVSFTASVPFPPPGLLREYNQLSSGLGERIMQQLTLETEHRQKLELMAMGSDIQVRDQQLLIARRGQVYSFTISGLAIVAAVVLGLWGQPWLGSALGAGGLATVLLSALRKPVVNAPEQQTASAPEAAKTQP